MLSFLGVPMLAFPWLVIYWTAKARWWRVALLLGVTIPISLVTAAGFLLEDKGWMDSSPSSLRFNPQFQHYTLDGWYLVWFIGAYYTAIVFVAALLGWPVVRVLWSEPDGRAV